jgi:hypothetical protein
MNAVLDVPAVHELEPDSSPHLVALSGAAEPLPAAQPCLTHLLRGAWVKHVERRGELVVLRTRAGGVYALDVRAIELAAMGAGLQFRGVAPLERVR